MADLKALSQAIIKGDQMTATKITQQAISDGMAPGTILEEGLIAGMNTIGVRFKANEVYIPEVLIAARAMKNAMTILEPKLVAAGVKPRGKAILGTVQGDLHDIGKNLVAAMLEGGGFEVIDLGVDVKPERFVAAVKDKKPHIVAMSALLTTTMRAMKTTIDALQQAGVRQHVKVLVGGAPITLDYAQEIGADGFSDSASGVLDAARKAVAA